MRLQAEQDLTYKDKSVASEKLATAADAYEKEIKVRVVSLGRSMTISDLCIILEASGKYNR